MPSLYWQSNTGTTLSINTSSANWNTVKVHYPQRSILIPAYHWLSVGASMPWSVWHPCVTSLWCWQDNCVTYMSYLCSSRSHSPHPAVPTLFQLLNKESQRNWAAEIDRWFPHWFKTHGCLGQRFVLFIYCMCPGACIVTVNLYSAMMISLNLSQFYMTHSQNLEKMIVLRQQIPKRSLLLSKIT